MDSIFRFKERIPYRELFDIKGHIVPLKNYVRINETPIEAKYRILNDILNEKIQDYFNLDKRNYYYKKNTAYITKQQSKMF